MSAKCIGAATKLVPLLVLLPVLVRPAAAQVVSGSYVGNGVNGRAITGVGFRPDVVLIASDETGFPGAERWSVIRTSTMSGNTSKALTFNAGHPLADRIQSLDGDGFTVGHPSPEPPVERQSDVNHPGVTYHWTAFKAVGGELVLGTYVGDGSDNRNITGVGFQPDYLLVLPDSPAFVWQRSSAMPAGDLTYSFEAGSQPNLIQVLQPDGFQVGSSIDINGSGVTYHYAAWKAIAGKMRVGSYTGNGADNRSITGVGFRPEHATVKRAVIDDAVMKSTSTGTGVDTSLAFRCFNTCADVNGIQALENDGFQVGDRSDVNLGGETYYYAAFGNGSCPPLGVSQGGNTVTVTAPGSFELVFDTHIGAGVRRFYDLKEDPSRSADLVGDDGTSIKSMNHFGVLSGGTWYDPDSNTGDTGSANYSGSPPRLHVLEATPTRVRLRQEAFLQSGGTAVLGATMGFGDYTIQLSGRSALRWNRKTYATVPVSDQDLALGVYEGACPPDPPGLCGNLSAYQDSGVLPPAPGPPWGLPGTDFVFAKREAAGVRTDFLNVLYQDWALADRSEYVPNVSFLTWRDVSGGNLGSNDVWNFLTYFKPTDLGDTANPWADPDVTGRSSDYRAPDSLLIMTGTSWNDPSENSSGDDFNESEAAYVLTYDPALGLVFDIDGAAPNRYSPFLKIRQWRSLADPATVDLEGATLVNDADYRADVKPVARAYIANSLSWHCTMENASACSPPALDVGGVGSISGSVINVVSAKHGNGILFNATDDQASAGSGGSLDFNDAAGAVDFWYKPNYPSTDPGSHILWFNQSVDDCFVFEHTGGQLKFVITVNGACSSVGTYGVTASAPSFSWRADDWVHLRSEWNASAATKLKIFVNGRQVASSAAFSAVGITHGPTLFGGCSGAGCPYGASRHADGILDEVHIYSGVGSGGNPEPIAQGGLAGDSREFLGTGSRNATLLQLAVDGSRRGRYLYLGSDSKFRGLNVALATKGTGVVDVQWQYWNGAAWADLESGFGFTDETSHFTKDGTVYWTGDPAGWSLYSVDGGPELYFVRAYLASGSYGAFPIEGIIKTDILLFQYCGTITANAQTFTFTTPIPTAVELLSFSAEGEASSIALSWETGSELSNAGFHLYRGTSASGPFERITPVIIPGLGSSPVGARYRYVDRGLSNEATYFYELEDVDTAGKTTRHGPVSATPLAGASPPGGVSSASTFIMYGDPSRNAFRVLRRGREGLVLELETHGFFAEPREDGTVRVWIPDFEGLGEEGRPSLPVKRSWVEAVAGRGVHLSFVRPSEAERVEGLVPATAERLELEANRRGTVRLGRRGRTSPSRGTSRSRYPAELARLAEVGFQGDVKKALVELAPLVWDGASGRLVLTRKLVVGIAFTGREARETTRDGWRGRRRPREERRTTLVLRRLVTREPGLYGARFDEVFGSRGRAVATESLLLSRRGEGVPYHVEPNGDLFGPGSTLYFLSDGADVNPDGKEAVYELREGTGMRLSSGPGLPASGASALYWHVEDREENRLYQPGLLEAEDVWQWDLLLGGVSRSYPFEVSALAPAGEGARLSVRLQGATDTGTSPDHHVRVYVNGEWVGEASFEGKRPARVVASLAPSVLREGENALTVENAGDTGAPVSMILLDGFMLRYPRRAELTAGELDGQWTESGAVRLDSAAYVIDRTSLSWLGMRTDFTAEAGHGYRATSPERILRPEVRVPLRTRLRNARSRAQWLLIGPEAFLNEASPLVELRKQQGLSVKAVSMEEIVSEFGHGEWSPEAVARFLSFAYHEWDGPPRYVVLLGDATYDPKDYLKTGISNRVPTPLLRTSYLLTASDPSYGAVNGEDLLPDVAVGRLPAATVEEARRLVEKVVSYETSGASLTEGAVSLVADNPDRSGSFERDAEELSSGLLASRRPERLYLRELGSGTRDAIRSRFDEGASLVSYLGHGGIHLWADENVWNTADAAGLAPQWRQPLVLTMNCLNGYFHFPYFDSLAEALLKTEGRGSIAGFSPSGLSLNEPAHRYHQALLAELTAGRHRRLGDAVLSAQAAYAATGAFPELLSIYHLFGDPALSIR